MNYEISPNGSAEESPPFADAEAPQSPNGQQASLRDAGPAIPYYLRDTYTWAYLNPRGVKLLDHEWIVKTILWHQHRKLEQATFAEIDPGSRVLQTACVYGDFSPALARHVGEKGSLEVVDVARIQVDNCAEKLRDYPFASVRHLDVLDLGEGQYDVVCCYFLMHEMPDDCKRRLVDVVLNSIAPDGKVVFVDYHKPHWANPAKLMTSLVFDLLEPFAKSLWRQAIPDFGREPEKFHWRKETFFGGLYQKVVATSVECEQSWKR
jgi:ubiquinone/menaquinone biosynthesis C-methylase UbiE